MMKRLCALFLCMTMLLSLVCVAQAENTYYRTDEFDTDPLGDFNPVLYRGTYASGGVIQGSQTDIIGASTYWTNTNSSVHFEIIKDGYQGQGLNLRKEGTDSFALSTEQMPASTDENPVYVNFKLKVLDDANGSATTVMQVGNSRILNIKMHDGVPKMWPEDDDYLTEEPTDDLEKYPNGIKPGAPTRFPYKLDRWYDISFKYGTDYVYITVKDNLGNVAVGRRPKPEQTDVRIISDKANDTSIVVDEMYAIQGNAPISFVSSNIGAVPVVKTKDVHEDLNFAEPACSNGNTTEPFSWYMRVDSPIVASSGLGTSTAYFGASYCTVDMVDDCNGGYAAKITPVAGKVTNVNIGAADITAENKAFVSFKFKYDTLGTDASGNPMHILDMGFGTATSTASSAGYDLRIKAGNFDSWNYWGRGGRNYQPFCNNMPDIWYTIVVEFQKVNDVNQAVLYVYDDLGNRIIYQQPVAGQSPSKSIEKATVGITEIAANTLAYYLDDLRVLETPATTDSELFIKQEILGENPSTSLPVVKVEFDQVVAEESTAVFNAADGSSVPAVISFAGGSPFVEIKPATPLKDGTTYTLDLSGIKGLDGNGPAAGSVTSLTINAAPYSLGSMTVGEYSIASGELTLPVTFANADLKELNTTLFVALYTGDALTWAGFKDVKGAALGENIFTFNNVPEGAEAMTLKVFAWDNLMSLRPLYK